ncbi:MAG: 16S rRNA (guanine(527)-N(7))-methyltransferase RsmG [Deltaproteobacteria bacterium]|jgi:16S rRNA (guanine527-N7)-methyltransferase|nr:16S rRNA (guanine(527)-N(7))-methyltransferase RsmG [Deltaproteobacteria bacterium]
MIKNEIDRQLASLISAEFLKAGQSLELHELERLVWLDTLLKARNEALDLTRIDGEKSLIIKHYLDSAIAATFIEPKGVLMDLGTGAGFPGLVMAILRPYWKILLAEPRRKRLAFIEEAVELLGLKNVELFPHKVTPAFKGDVESIVVRDFGSVSQILPLAAAILPRGGRLHLLKGPKVDNEMKLAAKTQYWSEFDEIKDSSYFLGAQKLQRRVISFVKGSDSERTLPSRQVLEIASPMNPRFKNWLQLLDGRGVKKYNQAIISGVKFVKEILRTYPHEVLGLLAVKERDYGAMNIPNGIPIHHLRAEIFAQLDLFGTGPPLLVLKAQAPPIWEPEKAHKGVRLFVPFQDPANVGTVIRSAAALGVEAVLLKQSANPFHPKALRAGGPAVYQAAILQGPSLEELKDVKSDFFALSTSGRNIFEFNPPDCLNLVMGLEGTGLDDLWPLENRLTIPMAAGVESLNAAAAAAIAMATVVNAQTRRCTSDYEI